VGFPIEVEFEIEESSELGEFSEGIGGAVVAPVQLEIGRWSRWIAVAGGLGYVPIAPGTAGSFGGVLLFLLAVSAGTGLSRTSFLVLYALAVGALLLLGIRASGRAEVDFGRRDDGRIVIDEVVGQLIALAPLVPWARFARDDLFLLLSEVVTGFVLFRLFDVWKPGAVRWAERRFEGGLGVMADDVVAGLYAGLCLFVLHLLVFERFFSSSVSLVAQRVALKVST
jgi:phosphatidylglycerophosphatase A